MNDYVPTDYQKKAFKVVDDGLDIRRELPTRTDSAFQYSVAKWVVICEKLERGIDISCDGGPLTCALCGVYAFMCLACPIGKLTGTFGCGKTPYDDYDFVEGVPIKEKLKIARKELAFLQKVYRWWMMRGQ